VGRIGQYRVVVLIPLADGVISTGGQPEMMDGASAGASDRPASSERRPAVSVIVFPPTATLPKPEWISTITGPRAVASFPSHAA
jgi:hypothetical protein